MRKEVLFAVLAGGLLGLIIAFGVSRLNSTLSDRDSASTEASPTPSTNVGLTLAKPSQNQVFSTSTIELSGLTTANTWIVISDEEEDYVIQTDNSGAFLEEVSLVGGLNQIVVTALAEDGSQISETVRVAYSTEFEVEQEIEEEASEESTESSEVRQKVEEKVNEARTVATFYLGAVTDLSETTIQLKNLAGEIEQVAISNSTSYATNVGTAKDLEAEDVALGDFVLAMGFANGNGVLEAGRVLVTSEPSESSAVILIGTITEINTGDLILELPDGAAKTIDFPKTWKGPDLDELEVGQGLITIGVEEDEVYTARTIEPISESSPTSESEE